jgi:hypothetical protein
MTTYFSGPQAHSRSILAQLVDTISPEALAPSVASDDNYRRRDSCTVRVGQTSVVATLHGEVEDMYITGSYTLPYRL